MFHKKSDFNKVTVFTTASGSKCILKPQNPHKKLSDDWRLFEDFKRKCTFAAAGSWPSRKLIVKSDIGFKYLLFARRIDGPYDPLTDTYSTEIVLDVEEAAVYLGGDLLRNVKVQECLLELKTLENLRLFLKKPHKTSPLCSFNPEGC